MLGIDEAGRGSVIGPLVVGGFLVPRERLPGLAALGARDAKLLSPARREEAYRALGTAGRRVSVSISPRTIDQHVRRHGLNRLEAEAFARLVRRTAPSEVYVDACDVRPERFGALVRQLSGSAALVRSTHGADRRFAIVGAASIVAKVRRDRAIAELRSAVGSDFGSGYPSDPKTVEYLGECLRPGREPPRWLRRSWATTARLMARAPAPSLESYSP